MNIKVVTMDPLKSAVSASIEWALSQGLAFKTNQFSTKHCPFTLTPSSIERDRFDALKLASSLFGKLIHGIAKDEQFIQQAISPIADTDPLFSSLLKMHQELSITQSRRAIPLLLMRTDFMDDAELGPKLIEFNAIAAGMGPFGQRASELHRYISEQHSNQFQHYSDVEPPEFIPNAAIEGLSDAIAKSAQFIKQKHSDEGAPTFLMIVQENEDNVYDQHLLEYALNQKGIRTRRKTFFELHQELSTGSNHRLLLNGEPIDVVYLRAGYQQSDYYDHTIVEQYCCNTLMSVRMVLEHHDIAMNATIAQQLASSKRVQMLVSNMTIKEISHFGLTRLEALQIKPFFGDMLPLNSDSIGHLMENGVDNWVLKNQGEGGGHCIFGQDIVAKLKSLEEFEYDSWSLMRKVAPTPRTKPSIIIRDGEAELIADIISEIGIFTANIDGVKIGEPVLGYLVRSKSADVTEGGVHSGQGAVDSLIYR